MRARKRGFKHFYLKGLLDVDPVTKCWIWLGRQYGGYGRVNFKHPITGRWTATTAQRYFFRLYIYNLPDHLDAAHECHRRSCVNPRHLRPDTRLGNVSDWFVDQRFTPEQCDEVARLAAIDLPVSVIADKMCAPRPYIHRLLARLDWEKYQINFEFGDTA